MRDHALVYINGQRHEIRGAEAFMMAADYLRKVRRLTGTKIVCAEGDCGACTVLMGRPGERFVSINSCIMPMALCDGAHLLSVESLQDGDVLHPIQQAMVEHQGGQCGFCTPGMCMAMAGGLEKKKPPVSEQEHKNQLTGNLCRCTGYTPILEAAMSLGQMPATSKRYHTGRVNTELKSSAKKAMGFEDEHGREVLAPTSLKQATAYLAKGARVWASGTDLGVAANKGFFSVHEKQRWMSLHLLGLDKVTLKKDTLEVGARVTLSALRRALVKGAPEAARFLDLFASPQIKHVATLVGNVANASPIADTPPFLLVTDTVVCIAGPRGKRRVSLADFYKGYRKTALKRGELITSLQIKLPAKGTQLRLYKNSRRKDLDISCVNAGFSCETKGKVLSKVRVALGGVAATPLRLQKFEARLEGLRISELNEDHWASELRKELKPISDARGSRDYRLALAGNFLKAYLREVSRGL